jgi:hypothetical protein
VAVRETFFHGEAPRAQGDQDAAMARTALLLLGPVLCLAVSDARAQATSATPNGTMGLDGFPPLDNAT